MIDDNYFLYDGHILKSKQGEWGKVDAIDEFNRSRQTVYHKPYDREKAERIEAEKWKQIREELGIENEKDK